MRINIHKSSIEPMIEICRKHKAGLLNRDELVKFLECDDYQVEFNRYSSQSLPVSTISKDEFVDYFMNIFDITEDLIKNPRLKNKHNVWKIFLNDIDGFVMSNEEFSSISHDDIQRVQKLLKNSFPESLINDFADIECVFTLSIGDSMGYPYKNYIHFDFLNLSLIDDKETFVNFIAHEIHHIVYSKIMSKNMKSEMSPLEHFVVLFSFEGLAVKFCNNGCGSFTTPLYSSKSNIGMTSDTWSFYEKEFNHMLQEFVKDFIRIKTKQLNHSEVGSIIKEKWLTPNIVSFIDSSELNVTHYRNYYLGMQLFGFIYDRVGLSKMFDMLLNPSYLVNFIEKNIVLKNENLIDK